jgi:hypothetical protein
MTVSPINQNPEREVIERLVRMETKLDAALIRSDEDRATHHRDVTKIREDLDETDGRVGKLENWKYAVSAAVLLSGGSIALTASNVASATGK